MSHAWDRGVLNASSWHGLEEVGTFVDAASAIVHGQRSGAWPVALRTEELRTSSGLIAPLLAQVASYVQHPERVVGARSDRYRATQVNEWCGLVQAAVEAGAKPTGAFSLCGGSKVLATFEVGVSNGLRTQLLIVDTFDGSMKLTVGFTTIRVVCANTLAVSMSQDSKDMAALRHTANLESRVRILQNAIGPAVNSGDTVRAKFEAATVMRLDRDHAKKVFDALFPEAPADATPAAKTRADSIRHDARVAAAMPINQVGKEKGNVATLWNAATYLVDRTADGGKRESRGGDSLNTLLFGSRAQRLEEIREVIEVVMADGSTMSVDVPRANEITPRYTAEDLLG